MGSLTPQSRPEDRFHSISQYSGLACFQCNARAQDGRSLSVCSRCQRVRYCSAGCQKKDFFVHKALCIAWATQRKAVPPDSYPSVSLPVPTRAEIKRLLQAMNDGMLGPLLDLLDGGAAQLVANYLIFNEPRCGRCLRLEHKGHLLVHCLTCRVHGWCPNEGCRGVEEEHQKSGLCTKILDIVEDEDFLFEYSRAPDNEGPVVPWCPDRVLSSPTPLPADWNSYLESVSAPAFEITFLRTMAKHQLSLPLTILSALQRFGLLSQFLDLNNPRSLTVHVLGATPNYDLMTGWLAYEEILHFCPGVSELRLVLVGPNISSSESKQEDSVEVCETCKTRKRSKVYECHSGLYHEYCRRQSASSSLPDIAVAFNSGLVDAPLDWTPTLRYLINARIPSVFTSYNAGEAKEDLAILKRVGGSRMEIVWSEDENAFASGRRAYDLFAEGGTIRDNEYTMGFRGL